VSSTSRVCEVAQYDKCCVLVVSAGFHLLLAFHLLFTSSPFPSLHNFCSCQAGGDELAEELGGLNLERGTHGPLLGMPTPVGSHIRWAATAPLVCPGQPRCHSTGMCTVPPSCQPVSVLPQGRRLSSLPACMRVPASQSLHRHISPTPVCFRRLLQVC
jgi:hypothetical protein